MKGKSNKLIPPSLRVIIIPLGYLIIIGIISVIAFKIGIARINDQRKELSSAKKIENTLMEKDQELKDTGSMLSPLVTPSTQALPNMNPALMVISNMKNLMTNRQISLEGLKVSGGNPKDTGVTELGISFTVDGNFDETLVFLRDTKNILPLILIGRMQVSIDGDNVKIDVGAISYSSAHPEKLPAVTEPIDKITEGEFALLNELTKKTPPVFFELEPSTPTAREDPFAI